MTLSRTDTFATLLATLVSPFAAATSPALTSGPAPGSSTELVELAPGVYATIRHLDVGTVDGNTLFIINDSDVVVVDTGVYQADARQVITEIRKRMPDTSVEVLIPDFKGSERALRIVMDARPDILNHNLETAERLYRLARPGGRYDRALRLLANARAMDASALTKSGIILGMGEEWDEIITCLRDLRRSDVNIVTLGQYLRPSDGHLPVVRYYTPDEFTELAAIGMRMGFTHIQASPLTRSSYHAWEQKKIAAYAQGEH